jgi:hypothetical protein
VDHTVDRPQSRGFVRFRRTGSADDERRDGSVDPNDSTTTPYRRLPNEHADISGERYQ